MTTAERRILSLFRRYRVGPTEMLFVNFRDCRVTAEGFVSAMRRLIENGMVVKEPHKQAYSLTQAGYDASRTRPLPAAAGIRRRIPR
jgi:RIO-like serine/threonine protein kinase